jgi:hypothetical protein
MKRGLAGDESVPACQITSWKEKPPVLCRRVFVELLNLRLVAVEQHSIALLCAVAHWAIE